ncbi:MAG: adenylate/guanylate cyclase domain-containing protein [bacterium]
MPAEGKESASTLRLRLLQALGIGLLATICTLALSQFYPRMMNRGESLTWDLRATWFAKPGTDTDKIRLIFLDQYSLDWGSKQGWSWPWPRQVYGAILNFCSRAHVKAVAFDVIYSEPSSLGVDDDAEFGKAIAATPGFVGAIFVGKETGGSTNWMHSIPTPQFKITTENPASLNTFQLPHASFPIPEVGSNATLLATVFGNPDRDGLYRRIRPFSMFDGRIVPSLGLGVWLASTTNQTMHMELPWFTVGDHRIPLDRNGCAILRYRGRSQTHKTVNAAAIIESEMLLREGKAPLINPESFRNTYVFFGFTAPGLFDLKASPVDSVFPGVEIHATFLDNLLSSEIMRETPRIWRMLLILLLACAASLSVRFGRHTWQTLVAFVVFFTIPILTGGFAYTQGLWLPILAPLVATTLALIGALALNYATEGKQKRFIKGAFKQYLSPLVIEELVQHPERLKLGGELRELSIFFSDIRGFTSISEHLNPQELTALLNNYLTAMTDIIYSHGGTVDKYEGDAIIAFWNAPLAQKDHAQLAVHTALECQSKLTELNPGYKEQIGAELYQRIGLNSGPVVVGNMGSRQRFNYTFLGDAGNLAARLEGINKQFGTSLLISSHTRKQLDDRIAVREIARVQVVGRKEPVCVYEPMLPDYAAEHHEVLDRFALGLARYYAGSLTEALTHFASIESQDAPAAAYVRRCKTLLATPPPEWSGVWVMTEK